MTHTDETSQIDKLLNMCKSSNAKNSLNRITFYLFMKDFVNILEKVKN